MSDVVFTTKEVNDLIGIAAAIPMNEAVVATLTEPEHHAIIALVYKCKALIEQSKAETMSFVVVKHG